MTYPNFSKPLGLGHYVMVNLNYVKFSSSGFGLGIPTRTTSVYTSNELAYAIEFLRVQTLGKGRSLSITS